jgi:UDP-glucuronate 4-epimerase
MVKRAFVTGSAGFIGFHLSRRLLEEGWTVTGFDAITDYYDVALKHSRHAVLEKMEGFTPIIAQLEDKQAVADAYKDAAPDVVFHLAAQAGVRYSLEAPDSYISSNILGTHHVLEAAREYGAEHMVLASTSSVYGASRKTPYREIDAADWPVSLYAATKKANEGMGHSYADLWGLPITMARFFTVYGPYGRPDMALFKFCQAILGGKPIDIYNKGKMSRDFTYIDDVVDALVKLIPVPPVAGEPVIASDTISPTAPFRTVNIGSSKPVQLFDYISALEDALGRKAQRNIMDGQKGEMVDTWAETGLLRALTGFEPTTDYRDGIRAFVDWYANYHDAVA